jgi:hypothetical protein
MTFNGPISKTKSPQVEHYMSACAILATQVGWIGFQIAVPVRKSFTSVLLHNAWNVKLERTVILPFSEDLAVNLRLIYRDKGLELMEAMGKIVYPLIDWFSLGEFDNNTDEYLSCLVSAHTNSWRNRAPLAAPSRAQLSDKLKRKRLQRGVGSLRWSGESNYPFLDDYSLIFLAPCTHPDRCSSPCWEEGETSGGSFSAGAYRKAPSSKRVPIRQNSTKSSDSSDMMLLVSCSLSLVSHSYFLVSPHNCIVMT